MTDMTILVCDDNVKAATARAFLLANGYPVAGISVELVTNITYDAETYDGGTNDAPTGTFVVIGRK